MSSGTALCDGCFEQFVESLIGLSHSERDEALLGFDSDRQAMARAFLLTVDEHAETRIDEDGPIATPPHPEGGEV